MAIQKMRDGSQGVVAKVIVGLIILVFALTGMGSITDWLARTPKVASIGGNDVTSDDMQIELERTRRIMVSRNQPVDEDALKADVLEQLIARQLLMAASEDFDLHFGKRAADKAILETEAFRIDGAYNSDQYRLAIRNAGFTDSSYRDQLREDEKIRQISQGIVVSAFLPVTEARRAASLADQQRDLAWLHIQADDLTVEVEVTELDAQAEYDRNLASYSTEETVTIEYVELLNERLLAMV